jgi:hypothetical protein
MPKRIAGLKIVLKLIPEARIAVISLSSENCPNDMSAATRTAIGTDSAAIQPRFKNRYSKIVPISKPLPINLSIALRRNCVNKTNTIIRSENKKGDKSCFSIYLVSRRMYKITT